MEIWIEDANGVRYGDGPITTAQTWYEINRLNAAGEIGFTMPALDRRAALVRQKRWARAWQYTDPGGWQEIGYGRIESITTMIANDGTAQLQVAGVDELGALVDRLCIDLSLMTYARRHPITAYWHAPGGDTTLTYTYDLQPGDTSSHHHFDLAVGDYLGIRAAAPFDRITFLLDAVNTNTSVFTATYYDVEKAAWEEVDIVDGTLAPTSTATPALGQSGDITFDPPDTWGPAPGAVGYELRLMAGGAMNPEVQCADISVWSWEAAEDPLGDVMHFAPAGWGLDAGNGYLQVQGRPLGAELLLNAGFEDFTGTADDGTTDTFDDWTNSISGSVAKIEAVTDADAGNTAVKLSNVSDYGTLRQAVTVTPGQEYTLSFRTKGDGTGQLAYKVWAGTWGVGDYDALIEAVDCGVTAAVWTTITRTVTIPAGYTTATVMFYAPITTGTAAYLDSASFRSGGGKKVYLQLRDESVLEALRRIADAASENFVRSPAGRQVLWLGPDVRDSEFRALAAGGSLGGSQSGENVLLLTELSELEDATGVISRIYPYGGGMGAERVTLADVSSPVPAGYTLNKASNYLERDAAVIALGIIEAVKGWPDIVPADGSAQQKALASNALIWQAWQYLETHSATDTDRVGGDLPRFYSARVVKIERMVLPGYRLRLDYHGWRDRQYAIDIERDVWITAVTKSVDEGRLYTVGLELATVPRAVEDDAVLIARNLIRLRDIVSHNTASGW